MNTRERHVITLGSFSKVLNSFFVYTGDEKDLFVQKSCKNLGIWEQDLTEWMIQNIKPGWKCLDIGANIGYFTEVLARIVEKDGEVHGFEPLEHLIENYKTSTLLNNYDHCGKITMHPYALSNKNGTAKMCIDPQNIGSARIYKDHIEENGCIEKTINTVRLDNIYTETPDFIKIDAEGHEKEIFEGMHPNTKLCPLIVIEVGWTEFDFFKELSKDYDMFFLDGRKIDINNFPGYLVNIVLRRKK